MRKTSIALILSLISALAVAAQESKTDVSTAVLQVLHQQQEAWNRHDLEGFMAGYWSSPELTFYSGAKIATGWQTTLDHYRKAYQGEGKAMGKLEFSDLNVQPLSPDSAFVRGSWLLTMPDGKTPHGLFTLIFRKFANGWKVVHDHTSAAE